MTSHQKIPLLVFGWNGQLWLHWKRWAGLNASRPDAFWSTPSTLPSGKDAILIVPAKDGNRKWEGDELWARSLLISNEQSECDGVKARRVLSIGFPKFFNHFERPDLAKKHLDEVQMREHEHVPYRPLWVEKVDGSLLIRSVIDGAVHWRTRGSASLGLFEPEVMACLRATEEGRRLADDPSFVVDTRYAEATSLLFEYQSPATRIVVGVADPVLTFLGTVGPEWPMGPPVFRRAPLVERGPMPKNVRLPAFRAFSSADEISQWMETSKGGEGWVSYLNGDLLKWKSAWYIRLHGLKSHLGASKAHMAAFCVEKQAWTLGAVQEAMYAEGLDAEIFQMCRGTIEQVLAFRAKVDEQVRTARQLVLSTLGPTPNDGYAKERRKDLAMAVKGTDPALMSWAMTIAYGAEKDLAQLIDKVMLNA